MTNIHGKEWTPLCPFCEKEVEQSGKGRPKVYHPKCKEYLSKISWLEDLLASGELPENPETRKKVKSDLMRLSNLTNTWK